MNVHKYSTANIKGRPSIRDYRTAMSGSKSQPSSPLTSRRHAPENTKMQRRQSGSNSVSKSRECSPIDQYDFINGKQYSEEFDIEQSEEYANSSNEGYIDYERPQHISPELKKCHKEFIPEGANRKSPVNDHQDHQKSNNSKIFLLVVVVGLVIAAALPMFVSENEENYQKLLSNAKADFANQDKNFWPAIVSGLENVLENDSDKITVFLLLNSNTKSNGRKTINDLSRKIAEIAAKGLGSNQPIMLSKADVLSLPREQGSFIYKYRPKLEKQKVLLIHDLHEIPANVAQSFHYFCDSENPIVKKSVIIFTMDIPNLPDRKFLLHVVEDTLQKIWSPPLKDNIIHPLITRLTTNVVAVTPELIYYG